MKHRPTLSTVLADVGQVPDAAPVTALHTTRLV